jgi:hypothetical protein
MTREEIISYVMGLIDEVTADGIDLPVSHIERHLDKANDFVLKNSPDQMIMPLAKEGGNHFPGNDTVKSRLIIKEDLSGLFVLPTDFIRPISFTLNTWSRPVFEFYNNKDPRYNLQKNRKGRGNIYQPMGALVPFASYIEDEKEEGFQNVKFAIEFFTAFSEEDTLLEFIYIPKTPPEQMPEELLDPVAWFCAARSLQVLRRYDEAKEAERRGTLELTSFKIGETGENAPKQ